jgi:hypothetical protein
LIKNTNFVNNINKKKLKLFKYGKAQVNGIFYANNIDKSDYINRDNLSKISYIQTLKDSNS